MRQKLNLLDGLSPVSSGIKRQAWYGSVIHQDNDRKHQQVSLWVTISIEMLPLKRAIYAWKPHSLSELKQFYKDEWAKIHSQWCESLTDSYGKCLIAAAAKGDLTSY